MSELKVEEIELETTVRVRLEIVARMMMLMLPDPPKATLPDLPNEVRMSRGALGALNCNVILVK